METLPSWLLTILIFHKNDQQPKYYMLAGKIVLILENVRYLMYGARIDRCWQPCFQTSLKCSGDIV